MTHPRALRGFAHRLILALLALGLLSPARLRAFEWDSSGLRSVSIPVNANPVLARTQADLNAGGSSERIMLDGGTATLLSEGTVQWTSPAGWTVTQVLLADLNRDGADELAMIVWRRFAPWPVDDWLPHGGRIQDFHDQAGSSCHLILVGWKDGEWREVWAGSALSDPLIRMAALDLDGDGRAELVTLEGRYARQRSSGRGSLSVWRWNGFGFTLATRDAGRYSQLQPVRMPDGRHVLLAQ